MKITNEIYQVGGQGITYGEDAAVYLIHFDDEVAIVDSGCGRSVDKIIQDIYDAAVKPEMIKYLILTHCHFDHTGGAASLKEKLNCKIIVHKLDAVYLEEENSEVTAANWYGSKLAH